MLIIYNKVLFLTVLFFTFEKKLKKLIKKNRKKAFGLTIML